MLEEKQIAWQNINTSWHKGKILTGTAIAIETEKVKLTVDKKVKEKEIDSLIVNFKNIKVLIPAEELRNGKVDKKILRNMIGSELKFVIIEIDKLTNKAVASRKKAMDMLQKIQLKRYAVGDKIFCKVIMVYPKFIEVECLGKDLKLKAEDLEYGYVANLSNIYQVGDKIKTVIKNINADEGILVVSHKETKQDPYMVVRKNYVEGGEYLGIISGYSDNGVFVKLEQGIDTMASLPNWMESPPMPGDKVIVKVKRIQSEKRKIYSSLLKVVRREQV